MTITLDQVKTALSIVAADNPGHVDARVARQLAPRYVENGQPCCLVAKVLSHCGFTVRQLRQLDIEQGTGGGGIQFDQSSHPLIGRIAPAARPLLTYLQRRQDSTGEAWSEIADRALQRGSYTPNPRYRTPWHSDHFAGQWAYETFPWNAQT